MSFNIRFANPADGRFDWPHRMPVVKEMMERIRPDIIGTQEGRRPQLLEMANLLPEHQLLQRDWIQERMYPCLFVRKGFFEVIDHGDFWLSETPLVPGSSSFGSAFPRLCCWARLECTKSREKFVVFNTHLDHLKGETRVKQMEVILKFLSSQIKGNWPIILMGDFNEGPLGAVRELLMAAEWQFRDPWSDHSPSSFTAHHFRPNRQTKGERIDWIMHTPHWKFEQAKIIKFHREGLYPSDHFPVVATGQMPGFGQSGAS